MHIAYLLAGILLFLIAMSALSFLYTKKIKQKTERFIEEAIVQDRERIARELHDSTIQRLQAIRMRLERILLFNLKPEVEQQLLLAKKDVDDEIRDLKHLIYDDLATQLATEKFSLMLERFSCSVDGLINWQVLFENNNAEKEFALEPAIKIELLRICQQVIQNTFTHGLGSKLTVSLTWGEKLKIYIEDNGFGFIGNKKGLGHHSVEKRSKKIGATLKIISGIRGVRTVITLNPNRLAHHKNLEFKESLKTIK